MKIKKDQNILISIFIPHYDELSLFIMGYVCLLLMFANNPPSKWKVPLLKFNSLDAYLALLVFFPLLIGMCLCLYHAFTDREKTNIEKKFMIFFAAIINGFSGLWYGTYILVNNSSWGLSPFPIWNIISGYILISSLRASDIEVLTISDENVTFRKLILGTLIVTAIFLTCHIIFQLVWAATFSICVAWITNIEKPLNALYYKQVLKMPPL
jgi:hypothetical protein